MMKPNVAKQHPKNCSLSKVPERIYIDGMNARNYTAKNSVHAHMILLLVAMQEKLCS